MPAFPTGDELNLGELDPGARPPMLLRRSRLLRWLVLGLAMILAPFVGALSAIAYLSDGPVYDGLAALWTDDANGRCDVDALVGYWTVRTLALDSHGAPASQGAGALDMTILPADRCAVDIEVRRLANGEEQLFGADVPRGSARFTVAEVALVGPSATGAITLRGPGGAAAETYSLVVSGDGSTAPGA